jgi:glycosyltransferase involved in cell wall biosynthesis
MKVLQVVSGDDEVAGVQKHVTFLSQKSSKQHLVLTTPSPRFENFLTRENVPFKTWKNAFELSRFVDTFQPDIIHAHLGKALVNSHLAKWIAGRRIPVFYTQHIYETASDKAKGLKALIRRGVVRKCEEMCEKVIAVSEAVAKKYLDRVPNARVVRVYNGARFEQTKIHTRTVNPTCIRIVGVSRLEPEKQPELFLEMAKLLDDERFEIHIFGDGSMRSKLETQVNQNSAATKVFFQGWVGDLTRRLPEFDFALHFGKEEAFSLGLLELLSASLPLIAMDYTSVQELFGDLEIGHLMQPQNLRSAAEWLHSTILDRAWYDELCTEAFLRSQHFSEEKWIANTDYLYSNLDRIGAGELPNV